VEEMLGERVVGHVLGHEQPLVTLGAASDEVDEALVPHLPHPRRLRLQQTLGDPEGDGSKRSKQSVNEGRTRNCCGSGQERREKRLTAISRPPSSRPR
jgi:hypothetical protein